MSLYRNAFLKHLFVCQTEIIDSDFVNKSSTGLVTAAKVCFGIQDRGNLFYFWKKTISDLDPGKRK